MSPFSRGDGIDDVRPEAASDSDMDDTFDEDMEALRRACMITGKTQDDALESDRDSDGQSSESDEMHILRNIQERFSIPQSEMDSAPVIKPLRAMLLSDSDEDDFETLRAIQRRFQDYHKEDSSREQTQLLSSDVQSRSEISNMKDNGQIQSWEVPGEDLGTSTMPSTLTSVSANGYHLLNQEEDGCVPCSSIVATDSHFPRSCQLIVDALKKNRSSQRFIRNMLIHIEGKLGENKDLKERIKHLTDYRAACKRRAALVLSQKKDPRVKLISFPNSTASVKQIRKAKKLGPTENSHVSNYKMVMERFPVSKNKQPWSLTDKEKLVKGIKQQYLEMLMLSSMGPESGGDLNALCLPSVGDCDVASEEFRSFLPLVNWERLALMYFTGRTGAECQTRWLNFEDPLINNQPWTKLEEKAMLAIAQDRGVFNWIDIAVRLGTSRTPFQCLMRYQRSLNAHILKKDWTEEEDAQLRTAVEMYGENWQLVASNLEGRSGNQCSNRWRRTLHPDRQRVGRWSVDEDKRLKAAILLFGPKNWNKIAKFAPGRTQVQCRERWVNCLNPALNLDPWTEEEDIKLKEAIIEFGYCWSKIASALAPRTDNQCRRRWKILFPTEVPVRQIAWKVQKAALRSNFVDREKERPLIGPSDFCAAEIGISMATSVSGHENRKREKKSSDRDQSIQLKRGKTITNKRKPVMDDKNVPSEENHKKKRQKHLQSEQQWSNGSDFNIPLSCLTYESSSQVGLGSNNIPCLTGSDSSTVAHQAAVSRNSAIARQKRQEKRKQRRHRQAESFGTVQNTPSSVVAGESLASVSILDHCSQLGVDGTVVSGDHTNLSKRKRKCMWSYTHHPPEAASQVASESNNTLCLTSGENSALAHQAAVSKDKPKQKRRERHKLIKRLLAESCCAAQNMPSPITAKELCASVSDLDHCSQLGVDETVISEDHTGLSKRKRKCMQNHTLHPPESPSQVASESNNIPCLTSGASSPLGHRAPVSKDIVKSKLNRSDKDKLRKRLLEENCCTVENMRPPVASAEPYAFAPNLDHCSQLGVDDIVIPEDYTNLSQRRKCTQNHILHSPEEVPVIFGVSVPQTATAISTTDLQIASSVSQSKLKNRKKRKCSGPGKEPGVLQQSDPGLPSFTSKAVSSLMGSMDSAPSSAAERVFNVGGIQRDGDGEILLGSLDDDMKLSEFITVVKKEMKKK